MTIKTNDSGARDQLLSSSFFMPVAMRAAGGLRLSQPVFSAEGGGGGGEDEAAKAKAAAAAAEKARAEAEKKAGDAGKAAEALAAAEAARRAAEEKLREFGDATPAELKALRDLKAKAEAAEKEAAEKAKKAEEEKLKAAGDFDALKARMAEEHTKELEAVSAQVKAANEAAEKLRQQVSSIALGAAFAGSTYITKETVLTASMARKVFEDHFEVEGDQVVGYDAPRGAEKRVKLVDARGNAIPFDEAMKRIVESSPDRDATLRAQQKPGSGIKPAGVAPEERKQAGPTGVQRIALGLASFRNK